MPTVWGDDGVELLRPIVVVVGVVGDVCCWPPTTRKFNKSSSDTWGQTSDGDSDGDDDTDGNEPLESRLESSPCLEANGSVGAKLAPCTLIALGLTTLFAAPVVFRCFAGLVLVLALAGKPAWRLAALFCRLASAGVSTM